MTVAAASTFTVPTPGAQTAGTAFNETITAKDAYGNVATGYTGNQSITFTGPANSPGSNNPIYPATVNFASGVGTASITLVDAQSTTLTATQGSITGTSGSFTVAFGALNHFGVGAPAIRNGWDCGQRDHPDRRGPLQQHGDELRQR